MKENHLGQDGGQKASGKAKPQLDEWSDEGCRQAWSQKLEEQGQG
jgi:hypothetical protein